MSRPENLKKETPAPLPPKTVLKDFIRSFLMPTLIGKSFVLYFGINYSLSPDEGYGYGLAISIAFTFCSLVLFAWKYRNHEEL